jgi:hypothetical protein
VPWVLNQADLLVDVTKAPQMASKMLEVLTTDILYKNLALQCYHNAAERFSSNAVVATYLKYYQHILANLSK